MNITGRAIAEVN